MKLELDQLKIKFTLEEDTRAYMGTKI